MPSSPCDYTVLCAFIYVKRLGDLFICMSHRAYTEELKVESSCALMQMSVGLGLGNSYIINGQT